MGASARNGLILLEIMIADNAQGALKQQMNHELNLREYDYNMVSKWFDLKERAMNLRRQGKSIRQIEIELGIPRSTLSGWFRGITLSDRQKAEIRIRWINAITNSRGNAIRWHNEQKRLRIEAAKVEASSVVAQLDDNNLAVLELALAFLYLGEGSKKSAATSLGSSNPEIIKFYLSALSKLYDVKPAEVRISLHLRADQNPEELRKFWLRELGLPSHVLRGTFMDKRTVGRPTYDNYRGVCIVDCGRVAIQRRLVWISQLFCEKITSARL